jgi:ureidoacrylate peracid hydrolase
MFYSFFAGPLRVFYAMHHRYRPGDYETWKYIAPVQKRAWEHKSFEYGTWGGEIREEHWVSSGFANTDLDLQLKKHGIDKHIVTGSSPTRAWRRLFALPLSSATRSRW